MQHICRTCPVKPQCAFDALTNYAECGIYAEVWVPSVQHRKAWDTARSRLRRTAAPMFPEALEMSA